MQVLGFYQIYNKQMLDYGIIYTKLGGWIPETFSHCHRYKDTEAYFTMGCYIPFFMLFTMILYAKFRLLGFNILQNLKIPEY